MDDESSYRLIGFENLNLAHVGETVFFFFRIEGKLRTQVVEEDAKRKMLFLKVIYKTRRLKGLLAHSI